MSAAAHRKMMSPIPNPAPMTVPASQIDKSSPVSPVHESLIEAVPAIIQ
jgi:hypothetical protein